MQERNGVFPDEGLLNSPSTYETCIKGDTEYWEILEANKIVWCILLKGALCRLRAFWTPLRNHTTDMHICLCTHYSLTHCVKPTNLDVCAVYTIKVVIYFVCFAAIGEQKMMQTSTTTMATVNQKDLVSYITMYIH
jgi:hypothetical protein